VIDSSRQSTRAAEPAAAPAISDRIDTLERPLQTLYNQRAGSMQPGEDWGSCAQCGRNSVSPRDGQDPCQACTTELRHNAL
jgi:hypothetical protein